MSAQGIDLIAGMIAGSICILLGYGMALLNIKMWGKL